MKSGGYLSVIGYFAIFSTVGGPQNMASGNIRQGFGLPFQRISEPGQGNQLLQNLADGQSSAIVMILAGITTFVIRAIINNFII